jgi:arginyl-tRNA synthetase
MYDVLTQTANKAVSDTFGLNEVEIEWKYTQDSTHGDITTPVSLRLAQELKKKPQDIANLLSEALEALKEVEKVEVAGPGYVNVWLTPDALLAELALTRETCTAKVTRKDEAPVIIEYSDPNIAKPMAIHHIMPTIIGQAISNLYRFDGYNVLSWNYLGDWGTQFGKLAVAFHKWGDGRSVKDYSIDELLALYVRFHEEAEKNTDLEEEGRETFKKLENGDEELRAFWADVVSITKESLTVLYERLQVSFDTDISESFYEDKMEPVLEEGIEKRVFTEGERGALIVEFEEEKKLPPYMVRKSDGATLYSTRDLAQMRYRIDTFHPQSILIVTDIAQQLYFQQLNATCNALSWKMPFFENVLFGRMRFADKKMSTRKGTVLKLEDVLSEAVRKADALISEHSDAIQTDDREDLAEMMGIGALSYGILSQNRRMDIVFDWEKVLSLDGNSAPYLQYTHARAQSVLRKGEVQGEAKLPSNIDKFTEKERSLLTTLLQFRMTLDEARTTHMPHLLANYLFSLCQEFNAFYNAEPILKADEPQKSLRLALTGVMSLVLRTGADLLTLRVPDRM